MAVQIKYANDVQVSYSLTTYSPFEGFRIAFNGMAGRMESWEGIPWREVKAEDQEFMTQGVGGDNFIEMVNDAVYSMYDIPEDYIDAIAAAGLVPLSYEIEAQAAARTLIGCADRRIVLVADFGKTRTGLSVVGDGRVLATSTIATIGGELITTTIQRHLGLDYAAAEKLKIERGLLCSPDDDKLLFALAPIVSVLRDEISKFEEYWNTHDGEYSPRHLAALMLCGGQATLPGLVEYLEGNLDLPVALGNVWTKIMDSTASLPPIKYNDSFKYAVAFGLALRSTAAGNQSEDD